MMVRILCLVFTFVLFVPSSTAQEILVTRLPIQRELPIAHMHHVIQDNEGFMWYATEGGLCRSNGYQVDVFKNDLSHPNFWSSNSVGSLAVGKDDKIWVVTGNGLYYVDKTDYSLHEVKVKELEGQYISELTVTDDGCVWVIGGHYVVKLSQDGKLLKLYKAKNKGDGNKFLNMVFEDSRHNIWLSECRGILRKLNPAKDVFEPCVWPADCEPHGGFVEDSKNGCYWISTWGKGIVKYVPDALGTNGKVEFQKCTYEGNTLNSNKGKIVSLVGSEDGTTLWCSAMDGLYAYVVGDDGMLHEKDISDLLPNGKRVFASIFRDRKANVWVAAYSPRSFILTQRDKDIRRYPITSVLHDTGVEAVVENMVFEGNYAWIQHLRFGLMLYDPKNDDNNIVLKTQHEILNGRIMCRKRNREGVWACQENTFYDLTRDDMMVRSRAVASTDKRITSLFDDGKGRLWVGTLTDIWCYDMTRNTMTKRFANTGNVVKMRMDYGSGDLFFVSSLKGFASGNVKNGRITSYSCSTGEKFETLDVSPNGEICASTDIGSVYRFDTRSKHLLRDDDRSLPHSDKILDINFDHNGHLWILTTQFVREYNPESKSARSIYASDKNLDLDYFICLSTSDDGVCVGGAGGYCDIASSKVQSDGGATSVPVVTSITIDGDKTLIGKARRSVVIEPDDMNIEVSLSTLEHIHANSISYAYCFHRKGTKADKWIYLPQGHNTAYFVSVPKGRYVLEAKATDVYGNWGEEVMCLDIERVPAWWETWWMYCVYVFTFILVISFVAHLYYRSRMRKMEIQKLVKLAKEMRIAEEARLGETENVADDNDKEVEMSKGDQEFISKAKKMVESNLSNSDYTTEQFASDMCMSRMNLYRKLQKITGQKPTEFVRMIRLQAAAKMLKDSSYTVSEISEKVGFTSSTYFSRCFKEAFGMVPTQYANIK